MVDVLFPEPAEMRLGPLGTTEPKVHWYTESTRPEAVKSRSIVNGWYRAFPEIEGAFAARLRSERNTDHQQALDELFVHHLLSQHCEDVRYEEGGVGPDFRLYQGDECIAAVEVLSLFQPQEWTDEEEFHGRLEDAINARVSTKWGYFLEFEIQTTSTSPPPKRIAEFLNGVLAKLPPPEAYEGHRGLSLSDCPTRVYDRAGVRIEFRFFPMRPDAAARSDENARVVGIGHAGGGQVTSASRLRDRIGAKAGSRYDVDGIPFHVAVGLHDSFCGDDEVLSALYGDEAFDFSAQATVRRNNGLFSRDPQTGAFRHRRLSGIVMISNFWVWADAGADVALYDHPAPLIAAASHLIPFTRRFGRVDDSGLFGWA